MFRPVRCHIQVTYCKTGTSHSNDGAPGTQLTFVLIIEVIRFYLENLPGCLYYILFALICTVNNK